MAENEIVCPRIILCEGASDAAFFRHLIESKHLPEFYVTYPTEDVATAPGGRNGFTARLRSLTLNRGFKQVTDIVVVSDNDDNPAEKFELVGGLIRNAEEPFSVPAHVAEMTKGKLRVGIYMLPAPGQRGQLETLCIQACINRWPDRAACLDAFMACNTHIELWDQNKQEKMKIRTLISTICSSDPCTSLQYAWSKTEDIIPLDDPCFEPVAAFLATLAPAPQLPLGV